MSRFWLLWVLLAQTSVSTAETEALEDEPNVDPIPHCNIAIMGPGIFNSLVSIGPEQTSWNQTIVTNKTKSSSMNIVTVTDLLDGGERARG